MTTMRARIGKLTTGDLIGEPPARRHVDEREARQVAEAARQTEWDQPSFAKELYLGRFRLDLIHPQPQFSATEQAKTDAFWPSCAPVRDRDGRHRHRARIAHPGRISQISRAPGRLRHEDPRNGSALGQVGFNQALMLIGSVHPSLGALVSAHQSIGVPEPVKMFGTEEQAGLPPRCALALSPRSC